MWDVQDSSHRKDGLRTDGYDDRYPLSCRTGYLQSHEQQTHEDNVKDIEQKTKRVETKRERRDSGRDRHVMGGDSPPVRSGYRYTR